MGSSLSSRRTSSNPFPGNPLPPPPPPALRRDFWEEVTFIKASVNSEEVTVCRLMPEEEVFVEGEVTEDDDDEEDDPPRLKRALLQIPS